MQQTIPTHDQIGRQIDRVRAAMERGMLNDARFRALVESSVVMASKELGRIDPEYADRDAFEQSRFAAALLLARVYDEDGELAAMRAERDHYKKLAVDTLNMTPRPMFIPTP